MAPVLLVGRAPGRDEEVFWDDDQFVKNEEEEEISAQKNAKRTAHHEEQPKKELVRSMATSQENRTALSAVMAVTRHIAKLMPSLAR